MTVDINVSVFFCGHFKSGTKSFLNCKSRKQKETEKDTSERSIRGGEWQRADTSFDTSS
jgi:hypothetical protein